MDDFETDHNKDDYYQGAAQELVGVEEAVFEDLEEVVEDDLVDIDWAVDILYTVVYGGE